VEENYKLYDIIVWKCHDELTVDTVTAIHNIEAAYLHETFTTVLHTACGEKVDARWVKLRLGNMKDVRDILKLKEKSFIEEEVDPDLEKDFELDTNASVDTAGNINYHI